LQGLFTRRLHSLHTYQYYTSIALAQKLEAHKTAFTGTCIKNCQQIPQAFHQKNFCLFDKEVQTYRCGNLLCLAWRAPTKKERNHYDINLEENTSMITVTSRASGKTAIKPVVINSYNQCVNEVDLVADQHTTY